MAHCTTTTHTLRTPRRCTAGTGTLTLTQTGPVLAVAFTPTRRVTPTLTATLTQDGWSPEATDTSAAAAEAAATLDEALVEALLAAGALPETGPVPPTTTTTRRLVAALRRAGWRVVG